MRCFIFLLLGLFVSFGLFSQKRVLVTDKVDIKDSIRLRGRSIAEISRDSAFLSPTHNRISTQKAVRDFVNSSLENVNVDSLVKAATASGFLSVNTIPYVDGNGRLNSRGFEEFGALGSAPSAPSAGFRFYADASGRPSWRRADGFARTFDASTITGNRIYTLQDKSYTLADNADVTSLQSTVSGLGSTYFPLAGGTITGVSGSGFVGFSAQSAAPSAPSSGFRLYASSSNALSWIGQNGFTRTFDGTSNTANRVYTLPDASGTFSLLSSTQTYTGVNTFSPSGSGGAGFVYVSTTRPSRAIGVATTSQRDAMSGLGAGDAVFNTITKRWSVFDGSAWRESPSSILGGIGNNQLATGDANGNIQSSSALTFSAAAGMNITGTASAAYNPVFNVANATGDWFTVDGDGKIVIGPRYAYNTKIGGSGNEFNTYNYTGLGGQLLKFQNLSPSGIDMVQGGGNVTIGGSQLSAKLTLTGSVTLFNLSSGYTGGAFSQRSTMTIADNATIANTTISYAMVNEFGGATYSAINTGIVITDASTIRISGPPVAGTNITITNRWALDIASGNVGLRTGSLVIGSTTVPTSSLFTVTSTSKGAIPFPIVTTTQRDAFSALTDGLHIRNSTLGRTQVSQGGNWYSYATTVDILRDTSILNTDNDVNIGSILTTTQIKMRHNAIRVFTAVTASATSDSDVTLPSPDANLLWSYFYFYTVDASATYKNTIQFGTNNLSNGDGTYASSFNLSAGFNVQVSVGWDATSGSYKYFIR